MAFPLITIGFGPHVSQQCKEKKKRAGGRRINQRKVEHTSPLGCNQQKLTVVLLEDSPGSHSADGNEEGPVGQVSKQGFCMSKNGNTTIQELGTAWSGHGCWDKGLRAPTCRISPVS